MEAGASSARADGRKEGRLQRPATALEARGYRLGEIIGTGTFSVVQKAYSNNLKRNVAIKTILKKEVPPKYFETFVRREMEILQGLNHPNVIKFLESIETDKSVHMVMELAENGSLLASLRDHSHFDEDAARRYLGQILDVMEYCYKRGVVHRDIKLENLLLDEGFNIKLTDFGLARAGMFPEDGRPRMSESFCGSYAYAAPEVLTATRHDPYLSDVWSAGVVLYAMVFGRMPFSDRDRRQQDVEVEVEIEFPEYPNVSPECKELIREILSPSANRLTVKQIRKHPWMKMKAKKAEKVRTVDYELYGNPSKENTSLDPGTYKGTAPLPGYATYPKKKSQDWTEFQFQA